MAAPQCVICSLSSLRLLRLDHCMNLKKLPASIGNLPHLEKLNLHGCWNLEELLDSIANLQNLRHLSINDCIVLKGLSYLLGNLSSLTWLNVNNCWMVEVIHMQGLLNLKGLQVIGCFKLRSIVGFSGFPNIIYIKIERNPKVTHMPGIHGCDTYNSLRRLTMLGCSQLCLAYEGLVERLPNEGGSLSLSLNHDSLMASLDKERLPNELRDLSLFLHHDSFMTSLDKETKVHIRVCNSHLYIHDFSGTLFNTSTPFFIRRVLLINIDGRRYQYFAMVLACKSKQQKTITCEDEPVIVLQPWNKGSEICSSAPKMMAPFILFTNYFYKLSYDKHFHVHELWHNTSYPFPEMKCYGTAVLCFVSGVYAVDFPMHIPLPQTTFFSTYGSFSCFDFGEVIHMLAVNGIPSSAICDRSVDVTKEEADYPNYEALVKEGWLIFRGGLHNEILVTEICNIFYSELMKQRWLCRACTELPSQLRIFEFSALDLAGCQITKIYRHYNTYIMEEESGLTWNRRQCLFADDHALLLEHSTRPGSEHSFLAYPGLHLGLEAGAVANLYEMSIFMSIKGKLRHSRKLQEIVSINQQQIPPALNVLLQTNASSSTLATLATLHRKKLMDVKTRAKYLYARKRRELRIGY